MTTLVFDESAVGKSLSKISPWKQLVFLLLICERLLPNYRKFADETGQVGEAIIRSSIDAAWQYVAGDEADGGWEGRAMKCEQVAPDTEEFDSLYVSSALDAASAAALAMKFIVSGDTKCAVEAAILARDSVDLFVQEVEGLDPQDPLLESKIEDHPLMQRELARQHEDIQFLINTAEDANNQTASSARRWIEYRSGSLNLM